MMTYLIAIQPTNFSYEIEIVADNESEAIEKACKEECTEPYRCMIVDSWENKQKRDNDFLGFLERSEKND